MKKKIVFLFIVLFILVIIILYDNYRYSQLNHYIDENFSTIDTTNNQSKNNVSSTNNLLDKDGYLNESHDVNHDNKLINRNTRPLPQIVKYNNNFDELRKNKPLVRTYEDKIFNDIKLFENTSFETGLKRCIHECKNGNCVEYGQTGNAHCFLDPNKNYHTLLRTQDNNQQLHFVNLR
jgi:hypothetical protein